MSTWARRNQSVGVFLEQRLKGGQFGRRTLWHRLIRGWR